jgi:hypothetical protein
MLLMPRPVFFEWSAYASEDLPPVTEVRIDHYKYGVDDDGRGWWVKVPS